MWKNLCGRVEGEVGLCGLERICEDSWFEWIISNSIVAVLLLHCSRSDEGKCRRVARCGRLGSSRARVARTILSCGKLTVVLLVDSSCGGQQREAKPTQSKFSDGNRRSIVSKDRGDGGVRRGTMASFWSSSGTALNWPSSDDSSSPLQFSLLHPARHEASNLILQFSPFLNTFPLPWYVGVIQQSSFGTNHGEFELKANP